MTEPQGKKRPEQAKEQKVQDLGPGSEGEHALFGLWRHPRRGEGEGQGGVQLVEG